MKRIKFLLAALMLLVCVPNIKAQSLGDMLSNLGKTIIGDKATTASTIKGTWKYSGPACEFESDNLLAKAGGSAASTKIETKVSPIMKTLGMTGLVYTFDGNGNYTSKIKTRVTKGTYTFDSKNKTITFKPTIGKSYTAYVTVTGSSMSLVFSADKLMTTLQSISKASTGLGTTASTINSLLKNYKGMRVGFKLKK